MAIADIRKTVLETINEVRRKLNVRTIATVSADTLGITMLDYLNDTVAFLSDQGDWLETIERVTVTAQVSVDTYSVITSGIYKNIHDMYFSDSKNPMRNIGYDQMRQNKIGADVNGQPYQYALVGTDSGGNATFQVYPTPSQPYDGDTFNITIFRKPPLYTGADVNVVIPFDSRLTVKGLLTLSLLDESTGSPTDHMAVLAGAFATETFNTYTRFRGKTGNEMVMMPSRGRRGSRR